MELGVEDQKKKTPGEVPGRIRKVFGGFSILQISLGYCSYLWNHREISWRNTRKQSEEFQRELHMELKKEKMGESRTFRWTREELSKEIQEEFQKNKSWMNPKRILRRKFWRILEWKLWKTRRRKSWRIHRTLLEEAQSELFEDYLKKLLISSRTSWRRYWDESNGSSWRNSRMNIGMDSRRILLQGSTQELLLMSQKNS